MPKRPLRHRSLQSNLGVLGPVFVIVVVVVGIGIQNPPSKRFDSGGVSHCCVYDAEPSSTILAPGAGPRNATNAYKRSQSSTTMAKKEEEDALVASAPG